MAIVNNEKYLENELINVHRISGGKDVIIFLKNADHEFVEGLFYNAKHYGRCDFYFNGVKYILHRNKDFSFTVEVNPEQEVSTEQFS